MNTLLVLTVFSVFKAGSALGGSRSQGFGIINRQRHKLSGHVLRSVDVPSQISCAHTCMLDPSCVSTNYGLSSGLCEMNDSGVGKTGIQEGVLEFHKEFVYSEYRQEDCQLIGCRNGGTCVFTQKSKKFHCSCDLGWTGDACGVKKDLVFNFTTLGSKGKNGPTNVAAYKGTLLETVKINNGIQEWTVPITGRYQVEACGAAGGDGIHLGIGGKGARTSGEIQLLKETVLNILVGQQGQSRRNGYPGSGGGGTFIVYVNRTPLAIVGGGGGGSSESGEPGQAGTNGSVHGGSDRSGGGSCKVGVLAPDGGSGGGFSEDGCCFNTAPCTCSPHAKAGRSFLNGGMGGNNNGYAYCDGGFGGGGAYQSTPGGGGGYSGGGTSYEKGGGGGSFKISESWVITAGVCEGDGYAIFRYINS